MAALALVGMTATASAEPMQVVVRQAGGRDGVRRGGRGVRRALPRARARGLARRRGMRARSCLGRAIWSSPSGRRRSTRCSGTKARVIPTLAFQTPEGLVGPPASPHPELHLEACWPMRAARRIHIVGVVFGPRSATVVAQAARAAERLGLTLVATRVASGPEAVRALHAMSDKVDALWLPGDTDVVTPQVFQYALRLQLERGLPVAAATRQQVHSGALVAADFSPRAAGRIAADLANRYLEGRTVVDRRLGARPLLGRARDGERAGGAPPRRRRRRPAAHGSAHRMTSPYEARRHAAPAPPLSHARLRLAAGAGAGHRRRRRRHLLSPAARVHREGSRAARRARC